MTTVQIFGDYIPAAAASEHMSVLGKTGSGKTHTLKWIIERLVESGGQVCVLDPIKSDHYGLTSSASGTSAGLPFTILGGPAAHAPLAPTSGKVIAGLVGSGALPLSIIDMEKFGAVEHARWYIDFAEELMRRQSGVLHLVLEEADIFAPKERLGSEKENMRLYWSSRLARAGRSKGIRILAACQRTQKVHNDLLGSCEVLVAHRLTTPADRKPVIEWLTVNAEKEVGVEIGRTLSGLKDGEAWVIHPSSGFVKRVQFPRIKTFDNSKTPAHGDVREHIKTAPIDLDALRSKLGEAVKEAEANDPATLRARISALEAERDSAIGLKEDAEAEASRASAAASDAVAAAPSAAEIAEHRRAVVAGVLERIRADLVPKGELVRATLGSYLARVKEAVDSIEPANDAVVELCRALEGRDVSAESVARLESILQTAGAADPRPAVKPRTFFLNEAHESRAPAAGPNGTFHQRPFEPKKPAPVGPLSSSQVAVLVALARWAKVGVKQPTRFQLSWMCGVSAKSSGFQNNLGALRSAGLVEYPSEGLVSLMPPGFDLVAPQVDGGRITIADIRAAALAQCTDSQRRILDAVFRGPMERGDLAEACGVSAGSSGFQNNLGALRSAGMLVYPGPGRVAMSEVLERIR